MHLQNKESRGATVTRAKEEEAGEPKPLLQIAFDDERRIVGACLLHPALISKCGILQDKHFTDSKCRTVWSVMTDFQKEDTCWDFSTIESELGRRGIADAASMLACLSEGVVATGAAIEGAAVRVRRMSLRYRVLKEMEPLQRSLKDLGNDLDYVLREAHRAVESFRAEYQTTRLGISLNDPNLGTSALGSRVLEEIAAFIGRFVILSKSERLILTLWVAHTWAFEASDATPYMAVTSPEMRSGKTRLLEILDLLVRNPWRTGRVTAAVLARKIESDAPTLLLDEWDSTSRGNPEFSETLRGILNAGHRRNGKVSVCGPKSADYQPTDFRVFCPKVIAGIGKLPETIADRAIPIRLKRKAPGENVARFRPKLVSSDAQALKARLSGWVSERLGELREASPQLPEWLSDRQQDGAEPLLAIAELAGGDWPSSARSALADLYLNRNSKEESIAVMLLSDIRDIFQERSAEALASKDLTLALAKLECRPWPTLDNGRPITPNALARILAPFDIVPRNLRICDSVVKGYRRRCFYDSWNRYLTSATTQILSQTDATPLQRPPELREADFGERLPNADVAASDTKFGPQLQRIVAM